MIGPAAGPSEEDSSQREVCHFRELGYSLLHRDNVMLLLMQQISIHGCSPSGLPILCVAKERPCHSVLSPAVLHIQAELNVGIMDMGALKGQVAELGYNNTNK